MIEISGLISFLNELDIKVRDIDYDAVKHIPQKVKELLKKEHDMQILLFISMYVFIEDTYFFDRFAQQLEQITKKPVEIPETYYNC